MSKFKPMLVHRRTSVYCQGANHNTNNNNSNNNNMHVEISWMCKELHINAYN